MTPNVCILPATGALLPAARDQLAAAIAAGGGACVPLDQADAAIYCSFSDPGQLASALADRPELAWIQLVTAGIDVVSPVLDSHRLWTSAKGCYSHPIAEYVIAGLLGGVRSIARYAQLKSWEPQPTRSLAGLRVTVLGGGGIATEVVRMLQPFECEVTVVRRQPTQVEGAARTVAADQLDEVLPTTDVLVLALALTPETRGLVDAHVLAEMPRGGWLVNVARGEHVRTDDLLAALESGQLAGAVLDVTDPEPLPADHPLWRLDQCIITPHSSCPPALAVPYLLERVTENVRRFGAGAPLLGLIDPQAGY